MKTFLANKHVIHLFVLIILLFTACTGPKAVKSPELPEGIAAAMVPDMQLDGYFFIRQGQPTQLPAKLLNLPADIAIQSVEIWVLPTESSEIIGAVVTFPSAQDAEIASSLVPVQNELWQYLAGNNLFFVLGTGSVAEDVKKAITARQFVSLSKVASDAWDLMQRLPGQPASKPLAVGFIRLEDRLFNFIKETVKKGKGSFDENALSAFKAARIEVATVAVYSNKVLQVTDILFPNNLKEGGVGGILIAKSAYPGFAISAALGPLASQLALEKTDIDGKSAYYKAVDASGGEKVHLIFNNSGQYLYATAAANLERTKQLYRWVWDSK
ncbi:MAG: hypothetical protein Q7R34_09830 [Dehalococcoidia bacterium]|nr:hypothetical protein [Dehalococcoidia bacterium]